MRTLWSLNGIRKTVGLEPAQKDTFKKMWSERELKELEIKTRYGENIWNEVKDDVILSGMKRLYTKKDIMRLVQTWNLAIPDLTGKDYLGDGVYRLYDENGITLDYGVYSGIYTMNGETGVLSSTIYILNFLSLNLEAQSIYSYEYLGGSISGNTPYVRMRFRFFDEQSTSYESFIPYMNSFISYRNNVRDWDIYLQNGQDYIFDNYQFTLQIEKGDTATPLNMFGGKSYDEMINEGLITLQYDNQGHLDYMLNKDLINEEEYETYFKEIEKKEVI